MHMKSRSIFPGIQTVCMTVLAGAFCLMLSPAVSAKESKPCADDVAKLCKGVERGQGRIAKCLKEHEAELSPECKARGEELKAKAKDFAAACKGDIQKNCSDVKRGGGRIIQCLKQHEAELSPDCKDKMSKPKKNQ